MIMKNSNFKWVFMAVIAFIGFQSCQNDELGNALGESENSLTLKSSTMNVFNSSTKPIGNGVARGWVKVNKNGDPLEVGVTLSDKALMNLPDEPQMFVFNLPKNKGHNFYTHLLMDWNPHGHEPTGIYDLPHFDFHFYIIPSEERMGIPPMDPPYMDPAPSSEFVPELYMQLPGLVPEMGAHWVDLTSPELHGAKFTHTFIWGSYAGEFVFWEPMITKEYFESYPDAIFDIKQPTAYQKDGWYPLKYKVSYSTKPNEFTVSIIDLVYHDGAE
jgi:hypothetical protein